MMRSCIFAAIIGGVAVVLAGVMAPQAALAGGSASSQGGVVHPNSDYYRGGAQVRGYQRRRGGYSYTYEDSINTYGDSRGRYGSANSLRDSQVGRQTESGPFDHGFFFDSATGPHGGDSPYMN